MKIVIDIPKKVVRAIQGGRGYRYDIHTAIAQGTPFPKIGEWEICEDSDGLYGVCSECGQDADFTHYWKAYCYCPNCGAKMESEEAKNDPENL